MPDRKESKTVIVKNSDDSDMTLELASYLDVLGSSVRLKILKIIEKKPLDVESISHELMQLKIVSSRENTEKHVKKLLSIGLVRKEPGGKNGRAVMNYVLVEGAIETALRTIKKVLKLELSIDLKNEATEVNESLREEFCSAFVRVLGGVEDGKQFALKENKIRIGRADSENPEKNRAKNDISLSDEYKAVSRVWKPHALLTFENGDWYIEQGEGANATTLWGKKLTKGRKEKLKDEDMISLAEGEKSVKLLFLLPKYRLTE